MFTKPVEASFLPGVDEISEAILREKSAAWRENGLE